MTVEITKLSPATDKGLPYRATITTRDGAGRLVGVRVLRAVTDEELDRKITQLRGANARDDIATDERPA